MIYENFVWTPELRKEFSKVVLDNNHCIENLEEATHNFIKEKFFKKNGGERIISNIVREIGNLN
jgi:hypothetical protein